MELPEDIMNLRDLNKNIEYIAEDMWARIFGLTLSVACPNTPSTNTPSSNIAKRVIFCNLTN